MKLGVIVGIGDDGLSGRLLRLEEDDAGDAGGTGDFDESDEGPA